MKESCRYLDKIICAFKCCPSIGLRTAWLIFRCYPNGQWWKICFSHSLIWDYQIGLTKAGFFPGCLKLHWSTLCILTAFLWWPSNMLCAPGCLERETPLAFIFYCHDSSSPRPSREWSLPLVSFQRLLKRLTGAGKQRPWNTPGGRSGGQKLLCGQATQWLAHLHSGHSLPSQSHFHNWGQVQDGQGWRHEDPGSGIIRGPVQPCESKGDQRLTKTWYFLQVQGKEIDRWAGQGGNCSFWLKASRLRLAFETNVRFVGLIQSTHPTLVSFIHVLSQVHF